MKPFASRQVPEAERGFSLLEAMVALAIASIILAAIATLGSQVLRNWMRGQETLVALEMLQRGIGRLETDLSLAVPMPPPGSETAEVLFKGDAQSLMFPAATGFGAGNRGLELLSMNVAPDGDGSVLIRKRGPIANLGTVLTDPVALLRGRMTLSFSFRDSAGALSTVWENQNTLPAAVLVDIRGASGASLFPAAIVIPLVTNLSAACLPSSKGKGGDDESDDDGKSSQASSGGGTSQGGSQNRQSRTPASQGGERCAATQSAAGGADTSDGKNADGGRTGGTNDAGQ